jgi:protein-disulfide isomerase
MASHKQAKERARAERLAREAEEQAKQRRRRLIQYGSGATFLAICVIAILVVVSQSGGGGAGSGTVGAGLVQRQLRGIPQHDTLLGDPQSRVRVVEFGDLQCPVCKAFSFEVAPQLISAVVRRGTASYEFRQYTIIGPQSVDAAKAALAAGEQGRYWNFIELFYRNQGTENSGYVTDSFLESVARAAGIANISKWNQDRRSSKWDAVLARVRREAQSLSLSGTPSILIEGPRGRKTFTSVVPSLSQIESAIKAVE